MTKTVCDICGRDANVFLHCELPMYKKYEMTSSGKVVGEFTKIETSEVDLCSEHYIMLADLIETMKENANVL